MGPSERISQLSRMIRASARAFSVRELPCSWATRRAHLIEHMGGRGANQYTTKALSLDPKIAETHVAIAQIRLLHDWDWKAAREQALLALQLNPSSPDAQAVYARYL